MLEFFTPFHSSLTQNHPTSVPEQGEQRIAGLPVGLLRHILKRDHVTDLGEMIETASKYADADDDSEGLLNILASPNAAK